MQQATGPAGGALKPACVHPSHRLIGTPSDSHRIKIASARANGAGGRIIALKALRPTPKPLDGRAPDGQAIQTLFAGLPSNCAGGVLRATAPICSPHMYQYHGSKQAWSDMPLGAGVLNAYCGLLITSMGAPVFSKSRQGDIVTLSSSRAAPMPIAPFLSEPAPEGFCVARHAGSRAQHLGSGPRALGTVKPFHSRCLDHRKISFIIKSPAVEMAADRANPSTARKATPDHRIEPFNPPEYPFILPPLAVKPYRQRMLHTRALMR